MVSETAEVNSASSKGIFVASPSTTVTFVFCMRRRSGAAKIGSSSKQVSRSLRARSSSVVNPGPGPISNTFLPRSTSSRTRGNTSFSSVRFPAIRRADPVVYAVHWFPFGRPSSLLGTWARLERHVDLTHWLVDAAWLRRRFESVSEQVGLQRK